MRNAAQVRNFVVAGHGGSGKTSLCELMLFKAGTIARVGSIDAKNTVSDYTPDEQEKASSIYSTAMNCKWKDQHFFFMDTPGYGEFVGEVISSVAAADNALVVLDAIDGPQMGTARAWKFSRLRGIPRFGLINRLDKERSDFKRTLEQMRKNHGRTVVIPLTCPVGSEGNFSRVVNVLFDKDIPAEIADDVAEYRELLMDAIAETDEDLMERYLGGEALSDEEIARGLKAAVLSCRIIPVFAGSVAKDIGITELMDQMVAIFANPLEKKTVKLANGGTMEVQENGPGLGMIFKMVNDPFIGQLAFMKVQSGQFTPDKEVYDITSGQKERIGSLLYVNGKSSAPAEAAGPGEIVAIAKLKNVHVNHTLSLAENTPELEKIVFPSWTMAYALSAAKSGDDDKVAQALARIIDCDPTVRVERQDETRETLVCGMGDLHLHNVARKLKDVYKADVVLSTPKVPYRETITACGDGHYRHKKQTGGAGQFAEVFLKMEHTDGDFEFANAVVGGAIPKNFIPAVEKGVAEMTAKGPLVGGSVEGVKVTVYDGKYHPVDSNEMAFKIAARMAFRDAMSKAKPVLLEPIMKVDIHIPDSYMGDITGDLNHKRGRILGMSVEEGMQVVHAEVPQAELARYAVEMRSMTQGRGSFAMQFVRYEQVPPMIANEIIAKHQEENKEEE